MKKRLQSTFSPRQYMLSKDFELYYYDDTHLNGVKTHEHNYFEFYFFLQGDISMHIAGHPYHLNSGDVIMIPPGVPHYTINHNISTPYRRFIFWINKEYFEHLCTWSPDYEYIVNYAQIHKKYVYPNDPINSNAMQAMILGLLEEIHAERFGREARLSILVNMLILNLNRMAYEQNVPGTQRRNQRLYENLLLYIEGHLDDDLSLDNLADTFFVSKYHIAHIFKENLGLSIHQYITKKRLAMCRDALMNGSNISSSYQLYGFRDYSSFYRAFKKEYGLSPKEYKDMHMLKELK